MRPVVLYPHCILGKGVSDICDFAQNDISDELNHLLYKIRKHVHAVESRIDFTTNITQVANAISHRLRMLACCVNVSA